MVDSPRRGPGRPVGSSSRTTLARKLKLEQMAARISEDLDGESVKAFDGDAHEFLMSIYKDPRMPVLLRVDAAKACVPYEKPKLSAITVKPEAADQPAPIEKVEYFVVDPVVPETSPRQIENLSAHDVATAYRPTRPNGQRPKPSSEDSEETRSPPVPRFTL